MRAVFVVCPEVCKSVSKAKIGLFFGSDEGNTESIAYKIQGCLGEPDCDIYDIADVTQLDFAPYAYIILGIPTWDFGQIQSDWEEFWADVEEVDFSGKTVALFGLGDQFGYGDFFLDAMGMLHEVVVRRGAKIVGMWPTADYEFDASKAVLDDPTQFVGLALDEDQQPEKSHQRINDWCQQINVEMQLELVLTPLDTDG